MDTNRTRVGIVLLVGMSLVLCHAVRGDYVELNDGSVIEGTVLKTKDGSRRRMGNRSNCPRRR